MPALARLCAVPLLAVVLLFGCASEQDPPLKGTDEAPTGPVALAELSGRTFVVTDVTVAGAPHELAPGSEVRFAFEAQTVNVTTGCNQLFGSWSRALSEVTVSGLGGTDMGCEPALMEQETWLAGLLAQPITVGDNSFTIGDTVFTVADRELVSPDASLQGQRWHLDSLISKDAVSSVPVGVRAWLEYDGTRLAVRTGCNSGGATADQKESVLKVGPLALTRRACLDPEAQETEAAMLAVLVGEVTFVITEQRLTLTAGGPGARGLGFTTR